MNKLLAFCFFIGVNIFFACVVAKAAPPSWNIVPKESKISFTGTQNDSPVSGEFQQFNGKIIGDLDQLDQSKVKIAIDTASLHTSLKELEETLKAAEWFDVSIFPKVVFESKKITKLDNQHYQIEGLLTIRNKALPLSSQFVVEDYNDKRAKIRGSAVLKRTAFQVGTGEWGSTDEVQDEVKVNYTFVLVKSNAVLKPKS